MLVSLLNTLEYHQYKVKVKNHSFVYRLDSLCTDFPVHVHCALFCALCICSLFRHSLLVSGYLRSGKYKDGGQSPGR